MYLNRKTYVKRWEHQKPEDRHTVIVKKGNKVVKEIEPSRITYVTEEMMYWRKANAIHNWFVQNVQGGEDDCKEYYVSKDQLKELLKIITHVLKDNSKAQELLAPKAGFFFGTTEYDEWYYKDLQETKKKLEKMLAENYGGDYSYQASW